jgi:hypothetical protein
VACESDGHKFRMKELFRTRNASTPVSRVRDRTAASRLRRGSGSALDPIDAQRRDAKHRRHAHLARFAPAVLAGLDLRAARGYEPLLEAIHYSAVHRDEPRLPGATLSVLPAGWRDWTLDEDGTAAGRDSRRAGTSDRLPYRPHLIET